MLKKPFLVISFLPVLLFALMASGCVAGGTSYGVGVGVSTNVAANADHASPQAPMPKAKEFDENTLVFQTASQLAQRLFSKTKMFAPNDRVMVLSMDFDAEAIYVDKLKESGNGIDGVISIKADTLKAAEDGLITGLINSNAVSAVVDKLNGEEWGENGKTVFYANVLTNQALETVRSRFGVTKVVSYRWVAYNPGSTGVWSKKPTRMRVACRIIDASGGAILYNDILTEEYIEPEHGKK